MMASIWQALYKSNDSLDISGVTLSTMLAYSMIIEIGNSFTDSGVMRTLNRQIFSGEISNYLLLPLNFLAHLFKSNITENVYKTLYRALPPAIIAFALYWAQVETLRYSVIVYVVALFLGMAISFRFKCILGLAAIWLRNDFFLNNLWGILSKLFCGYTVPLWFFPRWFNNLSYFLPFRYILFEPTSILLGQTESGSIGQVLLAQVVWVIILAVLSGMIWARGRKRLLLFGG
jgi:ABC-2 type transport system permease protein